MRILALLAVLVFSGPSLSQSLEARVSDLETKSRNNDAQISNLETTIMGQATTLSSLRNSQNSTEDDLRKAISKLDETQKKIATVEKELQELKSDVRDVSWEAFSKTDTVNMLIALNVFILGISGVFGVRAWLRSRRKKVALTSTLSQ